MLSTGLAMHFRHNLIKYTVILLGTCSLLNLQSRELNSRFSDWASYILLKADLYSYKTWVFQHFKVPQILVTLKKAV